MTVGLRHIASSASSILGQLCAAAALSSACMAQGIEFTFDKNAQGWTRGDIGSTYGSIQVDNAGPATWNPLSGAGVIEGVDFNPYAFHFSPILGGGHGALFGGLFEVDFRTAGNGGEYPFIVLMSSTRFLVRQQSHVATPGLVHYSYRLNIEGEWYIDSSPYYQGTAAVLATNADIQAVLGDLKYIGISTDIVNGTDLTWTDNVRILGPACVPADINCDGGVDAADLSLLLAGWGTAGGTDVDGDGTTGASDLSLLLAAWG